MTDSNGVKVEAGSQYLNGEQVHIKADPDGIEPSVSAQSDDDIYEDAGDLDFAATSQGLYLVRVPKFLWENWSKLDDDEEIRLGTVRIEGSVSHIERMSLMLSPDVIQNNAVPKEYNMHVTNRNSANTFIFTEKDLPGYTSKMKGPLRQGQRMPPRPSFQDRSRQNFAQADKTRRFQPYFRKAIPKQTALVGQVQTEINCLPVENAEYQRTMEQRTKQAIKPKRETKLLTGIVSGYGGNLLAPGTLGSSGSFDTFIKHTGPPRGKPQETKAARMPQNELLDLIYDCFKRYNYWPLKSLKAELNQPEAYLKQTLEMVAHLVRQGPHAMTWQLKPESKIGAYADAGLYEQVKDEIAPDTGLDGASDHKDYGDVVASDEDEESVNMEDVMTI